MNKLQTNWLLPIIIALLITAISYLFLPDFYEKYLLEKAAEAPTNHDVYTAFGKISADEYDDKMEVSKYEELDGIKIEHREINNNYISTYTINWGNLPIINNPPTIVDIDGNGRNEFVLLYNYHDIISLHFVINDYETRYDIKLDTIPEHDATNAFDFKILDFYDVNNDGYKEVYLYVAEGYRLYPRKLYCVDLKNKTILYETPHYGAFIVTSYTTRINGSLRIVAGTQAVGNYPPSMPVPYPDSQSHTMIFDEKLQLVHTPVVQATPFSRVTVCPAVINGEERVVSLENPNNPDSLEAYRILIFDYQGTPHDTIPLPFAASFSSIGAFTEKEKALLYLNDINNQLYSCNLATGEFELLKINHFKKPVPVAQVDIDADGENEYIFKESTSNRYAITRNNLAHPVYFSTDFENLPLHNFVAIQSKDSGNLYCEGENSTLFFHYRHNEQYLLRTLLVYAGIFVIVLGFVLLINKLQSIRIKKRLQVQNQIQHLKFQNLRNQMSPHFTMNVINTISASILKNKKEEAYDHFNQFSRLVRSMLVEVSAGLRPLQSEIDFVESYLHLQKARFKDKFTTTFSIAENVNRNTPVPPLIIQNFVENAIKHGLRPLESGGLLTISVTQPNDSVVIVIQDNGVGREAAARNTSTFSTGRGNAVLNEYIGLINRSNRRKIRLETIDLTENGKASGTKIVVTIPEGLRDFKVV